MRPLAAQQGFIETYAPFVDFVKISNIAPRFYSEDFLIAKIGKYREYGIESFLGGILLENALAQDKAELFFDYLPLTGIRALEISDNIIDLPKERLLELIRHCSSIGLTVFVEWGEKYPQAVFDPARAADEINLRIEAGASWIIVEQAEISLLLSTEPSKAPQRLGELKSRLKKDRLIYEAEGQNQLVQLLRSFGGDINLGPNIDYELVGWLEQSRVGATREVGHRTIENEAGADGVRSRLAADKEFG